MRSRGTLPVALLGVMLLLALVAWLAEWPPFAPEDDASVNATHPPLTADEAARPPPPTRGERPATGLSPGSPPGADAPAGDGVAEPGSGAGVPPPPPIVRVETAPVVPQGLDPMEPPPREVFQPLPASAMPTAQELAEAVRRAVAWLRKKQARDGTWGTVRGRGNYRPQAFFRDAGHDAGPTALALHALLAADQPLKDPVLQKGFGWIRKRHALPATSMDASVLLLAVTSTADRSGRARARKPKLHGRYRSWARKLVDHLVGMRTARGWRYNVKGRVEPLQAGGPEDLVSTHLAALALLAANEVGIRTQDEVWLDLLRFTLDQQEPADVTSPDFPGPRGFAYILGHPVSDEGRATGGATACGIANLLAATHVITDGGRKPLRLGKVDDAIPQTTAASLPAALAWLGQSWSPFRNPGKRADAKVNHHHWLFALETAMDLHPEVPQRVGKHLWYTEVARGLIDRQKPDGHWETNGTWEPADVLDTAFAILVLTRATRDLRRPR